jgi:FkbH-like protein
MTFSELKKNLKKDASVLTKLKVSLLGDSATQLLKIALQGSGFNYGFNIDIHEADFNQVERQVFDESSELYQFRPDVIILFYSSHKLLEKYNKLAPADYANLADDRLVLIQQLYTQIQGRLKARVICYNFTEIDDAIFGNYASKTEQSFLFQLRKLNYELMYFAVKNSNFYLCDISSVQNQTGKSSLFQSSVYINSEIVLSIEVLPTVAAKTVDLITSLNGRFKKCLILDLDNTIWGGTIGDNGVENIQIGSLGIGKAFTALQYWAKKLKNRGIILAVCSKNTEAIAREPFEKHPDMVLRLDDIAVFIANWDNKVDNIIKIRNILEIGFDSMVFLDDNPFERNIVRENIPGITVPELPEDPAEYLEYLYTLNLFETTSLSNEDSERTKLYQKAAERKIAELSFTNENDYLKSLNMLSLVEPFNEFNTPRVAQLSQRSNQFNLRTVRYNDADISALAIDKKILTFVFSLQDKFGDNGAICVVILKADDGNVLFIDTWLMSCRVLKRGMENFTLNTLVAAAQKNGYKYLKGEYLQTPKNEIVKNHYKNLGFEAQDCYWLLSTENYVDRECFINYK